jgi:hypothetical protein
MIKSAFRQPKLPVQVKQKPPHNAVSKIAGTTNW